MSDVWDLAHGRTDVGTVVVRHGFHGPGEGQMDGSVWREDTAPLLALAARFRGRPAEDHPAAGVARQRRVRLDAERELLAALGRLRAPGARAVLRIARALDLGGRMSHGAIVARELGLPCVTCTGDGTRRLRAGDVVRVDGDAGRVEIVERGAMG
ncbi:MAG: PEP-utilizing enzyme [Solirubrobacteraceae bacterium]|nr:PEP-utilizing enzyme [Solirubrobacteraceae bacterium]